MKLCIANHRRIFDPTVLGAYYEKFSAAYATAAPPVLPLTLAREAVQKINSLRRQAGAKLASERTAVVRPQTLEDHTDQKDGSKARG